MRLFAFLAAAAIGVWLPGAAAAQANQPRSFHLGIELRAVPPPSDAKFDVSILDPRTGLERLRAAIDVLVRRSPMNARAIETLKNNGRVIIVYDPRHPAQKLTADGIAAFFPYFFRKREDGGHGDFLVVVGRHGIKWPPSELAAVLAHELAGHGMQRLRGEGENMRELERECEAQLYEEKAHQDLGVDKSSRFIVEFRTKLENFYCADFRKFQRKHRPETLKWWDARNPDVVRLLAVFKEHLQDLRARGIAGAAVDADRKQFDEELRNSMAGADAEAQYRLGERYASGDKGLPRDYALAAEWYGKAAAKGHAGAQHGLGLLRENGWGMARDAAAAVAWYRKAADRGLDEAQIKLALAYQAGRGVVRDPEEAYFWLSIAAMRGAGALKLQATALRSQLTPELSPEQIARAEAEAEGWRPR